MPVAKKKNRHLADSAQPPGRAELVKDIFSSIPKRYDLLNHLFSFGQDIRWRNFTVGKMALARNHRFLDVATGTADLAVAAARRYPAVSVFGLDFVDEMMLLGRKKIERHHLAERITLIQGDALEIPFDDNSFHVAAIAFGIRNIPDKVKALKEMTRVTVQGGQVMVLEMSFPQGKCSQLLFYPYLNYVLPFLSRILSKNPSAYRYLADSIMNFPPPPEFIKMMEKSGLREIRLYPLSLGITLLYVGTK